MTDQGETPDAAAGGPTPATALHRETDAGRQVPPAPGLAGAHGSRTHPAASRATAPVLKTGAATGRQPPPCAGW